MADLALSGRARMAHSLRIGKDGPTPGAQRPGQPAWQTRMPALSLYSWEAFLVKNLESELPGPECLSLFPLAHLLSPPAYRFSPCLQSRLICLLPFSHVPPPFSCLWGFTLTKFVLIIAFKSEKIKIAHIYQPVDFRNSHSFPGEPCALWLSELLSSLPESWADEAPDQSALPTTTACGPHLHPTQYSQPGLEPSLHSEIHPVQIAWLFRAAGGMTSENDFTLAGAENSGTPTAVWSWFSEISQQPHLAFRCLLPAVWSFGQLCAPGNGQELPGTCQEGTRGSEEVSECTVSVK